MTSWTHVEGELRDKEREVADTLSRALGEAGVMGAVIHPAVAHWAPSETLVRLVFGISAGLDQDRPSGRYAAEEHVLDLQDYGIERSSTDIFKITQIVLRQWE